MHQFDPGDRNGGAPEAFEAEHDVHPRFDVAMIPVDPVFQVPGRFQRYLFRQKSFYFHLARRTMGRCVGDGYGAPLSGHTFARDQQRREWRPTRLQMADAAHRQAGLSEGRNSNASVLSGRPPRCAPTGVPQGNRTQPGSLLAHLFRRVETNADSLLPEMG
jgi:hypothetical protein